MGFGFPLNTLYITWGCNHYFLTTISSNFPEMVVLIYMAKRCLFRTKWALNGPEACQAPSSSFAFDSVWGTSRVNTFGIWFWIGTTWTTPGPHGTGTGHSALGSMGSSSSSSFSSGRALVSPARWRWNQKLLTWCFLMRIVAISKYHMSTQYRIVSCQPWINKPQTAV